MGLRVEGSYLKAIYVLENWEEIYELGLKKFGVAFDVFEVEGDDDALRELVQLNNAFEILSQYDSLISPHLLKLTLSGEDLNLPDEQDDFHAWLDIHHSRRKPAPPTIPPPQSRCTN